MERSRKLMSNYGILLTQKKVTFVLGKLALVLILHLGIQGM